MNKRPLIIALYLPQFHPFKENDEWWGKGFTEWTSVGRAKPLFKGHYQPKVPSELGYYDLRMPIIREQQVELAKAAGVDGFCYWHYWFGNGKRLMETVFDEVLATGKPDFPFCLGWANHSWEAKNWNSKDAKGKNKLLIEQTFPGDEDIRKHYELVLKAFKDPRYIKIDNKPMFMMFIADNIPDNFISLWTKWAKEDGFDGVYFIGNIDINANPDDYTRKGFSAIIKKRVDTYLDNRGPLTIFYRKILSHFFGRPRNKVDYSVAMKYFVDKEEDVKENVIPSLVPNFDHSPRSQQYGVILHHSTPKLFKKHCKEVFDVVDKKENKLVLLRSWNEWGEGNYMEPDLKYGRGYIEALRSVIDKRYS